MIKYKCLCLIIFVFPGICRGAEEKADLLTRLSLGETCDDILSEFSRHLPRFIQCSVLNARPFTVCERCVDYYYNAATAYNKIVTTKDNDSRSCEDVLLNVDRIQVVRQLYNSATNLWEQSRCSSCFISKDDGKGHVVYVLTNDTLTFNQYATETIKCIEDNQKEDPTKSIRRNDTVCNKCEQLYCRLNNFYINLGETSENFCMDIVDKMNASRILWSQRLQCVQHNNRVTGVFISSSCICMTPLIFYFIAWWRAKRQEQCIIPQRRLIPQQHQSIDT